MYCDKCEKKLEKDAKFCMSCGNRVNQDTVNDNINIRLNDMNNNKKPKKSKKIIFIIGGILLIGIITFIILWIFVFNKDKGVTNNNSNNDDNNIETKPEKQDNTREDVVKSDTVISFYKYKDNDYVVAISNKEDNNIDTSLYEKIGSYQCYNEKCKSKSIEDVSAVIYDNDYLIYNISDETSKIINLDIEEDTDVHFITSNNTIYGLKVKKNNHYAYFDLSTNKYITDFIYTDFSYDSAVEVGKIIGYVHTNENEAIYTNDLITNYDVIDIKTGKVLKTMEDYGSFYAKTYNGYIYYLGTKEDGPQFGPLEVYNSDFELVNESAEIGILSNGNYMIKNDHNGFSIYDNKGKFVKESKSYDEVKLIVDDYIAVIDNGYLKLINTNEEEVANFTEWNDKKRFHGMISGYYRDSSTKVYGVYLVVEDESIPEGTKGRGKEYYYGTKTKETGVIELEYIGGYAKPILYLYPDEPTNVSVTFSNPSMLTTTYPKYQNSWNVIASPNGDLYDKNGRYYYGLYWEEIKNHDIDFQEGFYVEGSSAIKFLEEKLAIIGFTEREANEFIMYWLPILEQNHKNLVYFELTDERESYNKLNINPKPDSILRVAIHVKKVDKQIDIKEQKLKTFERHGFTAVEWGGVIH